MQQEARPHPAAGRSGLSRLWKALGNSWCGLRAAWSREEAFRQEVLLGPVLAAVALLLDLPLVWGMVLWAHYGPE